ncbi:NUDIX domain-containing protein [Kitasatospora sp. NPDC051914]|uniref:NUDIX domain-containing protein n=1 Tax=Kitasatospora sp. NPDC051914 TaxID=3154945 RepID=UPI00341374DD
MTSPGDDAPTVPAALAARVDALIRDGEGRILLVDRAGDGSWALPGGMLQDEEPDAGLVRLVGEVLGLPVEVGRLLAVDTLPAEVWGRTVLCFVHAAHIGGGAGAAGIPPQSGPGSALAARFFPEPEALRLLAPAVGRRLEAAAAAGRGAHTAVLHDGTRRPMGPRDHYAQLPSPMMAATVVLTDTAGRVLVLEPGYKPHLELPGGMVEAHESPSEAAARELAEELALTVPVGRLLVVDTAPASAAKHGRALTCMVFGAAPLTPEQAEGLVFADGEIRAAHWLERPEALRRLRPRLAARVDAAFRALAAGTVVHLEAGRPAGLSADVPARAPAD